MTAPWMRRQERYRMDTSLSALAGLLRETLTDPRAAARRILAVDLPDLVRWQALLLVVVLSVLLVQVALLLSPGGAAVGPMGGAPLQAGLLQGVALVMMVAAVHFVGRAMGGTGDFGQALTVVTWLQFVTLCFQLLQIAALVLLPPLAGLVALASLAVFLWLLVGFVQELHGFRSRGLVFLMILMSFFAIAFVLSILLAILGVSVPEPA
jgi:hypothetical protein